MRSEQPRFIQPIPLALAWLTALSGIVPMANAQSYPTKPITLVVPFSAGGDADVAARNLSVVGQRVLGQNLIIVNRAGAGGAIGSVTVRNAKPDGYTLLLARVGSQVVLPALQKGLDYKWNSFTFLGLLELNPVVCAVRSESKLQTMKDLVDAISSKPGKLNYSTTGPATILNFGPQLLFDVLKLGKNAAVPVTYKGGSEAALALLAGDVDFSCGNLTSMMGNIKGGKLHALMTTTPERIKDLPDVPTAREAGYPQLEAVIGWSALYGPPGLGKDVIDRWADTLAAAGKDAQWISATEKAGSMAQVMTPADTEKYAAEQYRIYERLGRELQIELN